MRIEKGEEREMEKLLDEIPHATSPHHHNHLRHRHGHPIHAHRHHGLSVVPIYGGAHDDPSPFHALANGHACTLPSPAGSSSSLSGTLFPDDPMTLLNGFSAMTLSDDAAWAPIGRPTAASASMFANNSFGDAVDKSCPVFTNPSSNLFDGRMSYCSAFGRYRHDRDLDSWSYASQPSIHEAFREKRIDLLSPLNSPHRVGHTLHCSSLVVDGRLGSLDSIFCADFQTSGKNFHDIEAVACEGSLIVHPKCLHCLGGNKNGRGNTVLSPALMHTPIKSLKYDYLMDVDGYIYNLAKDQHGCRFLQRKFDEGKHQVDKIFNGIIDHVVELMVNPFGNYLMQKLLEVCSEDQRMMLILVLTKEPAKLIRISLNTHGTRVVQKLIDTLGTRQQISLVVLALRPGFLDLIKDLNGHHVLQHCLQSLSTEDNKFIFDAAIKHCVDIATHRHGCCVLQRCMDHSNSEYRAKLVAEISKNGFLLAQDAFGNYAVQYILDLKNPTATANLASLFDGNYAYLSMQKFSSNVVEKCLKVFGECNRARIIFELLSVPRFEQLLQDPYANYVIQSALVNSKGSLHVALVEAIRPHANILRTSPYCKRIFSRHLRKK